MSLELFAQCIASIEEAFNLERLNILGKSRSFDDAYAHRQLQMYKDHYTVAPWNPNTKPPEHAFGYFWYNPETDVEWSWSDMNKAWEGPDWRWNMSRTNASVYNYVVRYYRQVYLKYKAEAAITAPAGF